MNLHYDAYLGGSWFSVGGAGRRECGQIFWRRSHVRVRPSSRGVSGYLPGEEAWDVCEQGVEAWTSQHGQGFGLESRERKPDRSKGPGGHSELRPRGPPPCSAHHFRAERLSREEPSFSPRNSPPLTSAGDHDGSARVCPDSASQIIGVKGGRRPRFHLIIFLPGHYPSAVTPPGNTTEYFFL